MSVLIKIFTLLVCIYWIYFKHLLNCFVWDYMYFHPSHTINTTNSNCPLWLTSIHLCIALHLMTSHQYFLSVQQSESFILISLQENSIKLKTSQQNFLLSLQWVAALHCFTLLKKLSWTDCISSILSFCTAIWVIHIDFLTRRVYQTKDSSSILSSLSTLSYFFTLLYFVYKTLSNQLHFIYIICLYSNLGALYWFPYQKALSNWRHFINIIFCLY